MQTVLWPRTEEDIDIGRPLRPPTCPDILSGGNVVEHYFTREGLGLGRKTGLLTAPLCKAAEAAVTLGTVSFTAVSLEFILSCLNSYEIE
jgi:hypothetical protein